MARIIRGTSKNARFIAVDTKDIVQEALDLHKATPKAIEAFGKLLTAGVMMGTTLKGDDLLTLRTDTDGPLNHMVVTTDAKGGIKGYMSNPAADLKSNGVAPIMGTGLLRVIKDMGLKEPYVGMTDIKHGDLASDLSEYFYTSEQTPTVIALGVALNADMTVRSAGGYMIQLLPNAEESFIVALEEKIKAVHDVTKLFDNGMDLERIIKLIYEDMEDENSEKLVEDYEILEEATINYSCNCEREKFFKGLITLGKDQLKEIFTEKEDLEVECHFCKKNYSFKEHEFFVN